MAWALPGTSSELDQKILMQDLLYSLHRVREHEHGHENLGRPFLRPRIRPSPFLTIRDGSEPPVNLDIAAKQVSPSTKYPICIGSQISTSAASSVRQAKSLSSRHDGATTQKYMQERWNAVETSQSLDESFVPAYPRASMKQKTSAIHVVSSSRRMFNEMVFFCIPADDIAPARRMRIEKAIQHGAQWARDWHRCVNIIIVEEGLDYSTVLSTVSDHATLRSISVVTTRYLTDCLAFGIALDPRQQRYTVKGTPLSTVLDASQTSEACQSDRKSRSSASLSFQPAHVLTVQDRESSAGCGSIEMPTDSPLSPSDEDQASERLPQERAPLKISMGAAFDQSIAEARALVDIPLDDSEEERAFPSQPLRVPSFSHPSSPQTSRPVWPSQKKQRAQPAAEFVCLAPPGTNPGQAANPQNAFAVAILAQLASYHDSMADPWRSIAYRKASAALRTCEKYITTCDAAAVLPGIGPRIAARIEEIATTGRLRRLEAAKLDEQDRALRTFLQIYGVGFSQAMRWVQMGFRTTSDLLSTAILTESQRIGIRHLGDFSQRIPREEVEEIGNFVKDTLAKIDARAQITIGGSYRRGATESGDIDVIVTKPGAPLDHIRRIMLEQLIPSLEAIGFLTAILAVSKTSLGTTWHGCCCLPSRQPSPRDMGCTRPWRRIDFLLVPWSEIGAALIYFTGNDIFNRSMRLLARKKGLRLNQHGLYKGIRRGRGTARPSDGDLLESHSEKRIFEILQVPWREPRERQV